MISHFSLHMSNVGNDLAVWCAFSCQGGGSLRNSTGGRPCGMMCSSLVFSLLITDYLQGPTGERSGSWALSTTGFKTLTLYTILSSFSRGLLLTMIKWSMICHQITTWSVLDDDGWSNPDITVSRWTNRVSVNHGWCWYWYRWWGWSSLWSIDDGQI